MEKEKQIRSIKGNFKVREESAEPIIDAYFSVYGDIYNMGGGMTESIARGAFTDSLQKNDIRALINHDTTLVLGRTSANTLVLHDDEHGLFGSVYINREDVDAMNIYARVKRGDVSQCSIGFNIISEETDFRDDDTVHWTIKEADLIECSLCTFPAYTETSASARARDRDELLKRKNETWKHSMKERLKHGTESTDAEKED